MTSLGNKKIMSRNIQKYMELNHVTRNDLCEAIGVKYTTLTDWIKGNTYPRIDWIEKMANYFGVRKSDLVEEHHDSAEDSQPFSAQFDAGIKAMTPMDEVRSVYARNRKELSKEERMRLAAEILQDDDEDL